MDSWKSQFVILNTNMVKMFCTLRNDYPIVSASLPQFVMVNSLSGSPYIHALKFISREDRDKALEILKKYKIKTKTEYPFFYKGENVTEDMIQSLYNSHGDFSVWKHIEEDYNS